MKLPNITNIDSEQIPDNTIEELPHALPQIKSNRAPGEGISKEMLELGGSA